jgi:pimeloyl-ACP methyl ester carboxylesterase
MPREPMPDVIVLLPGICGSVLRKDNKDLWAISGGAGLRLLGSLGRSLRDLALTQDPPEVDDLGDGITPDRLIGDIHLIPYLWKIDGYGKVSETIRATFDVTPGRNFFEFPYDWRRDNRVSARRLQQAGRGWLEAWRESSGNAGARLILVGHSMGGIVSRYFLECLDGWRDTRALITFGTPYLGALNALDFLANGMRKAGGLIDLSALIRSLTSVYQLLPVYDCYDGGYGTLLAPGKATDIPNVDAARAEAAYKFHKEIADAAKAHRTQETYVRDGYKIFPIVGTHQATMQSARRTAAGVDVTEALAGRDDGGDGTVPRLSATPPEIADEGREMYAATRHASLQNADPVLVHLHGVITGLYMPRPRPFPVRLGIVRVGLGLDDVYLPDEPVSVRVRANPAADLTVTVANAETGAEVATVPVRADNAWTRAECAPLPAGLYRMTVAGDHRVEPAVDVFTVLDNQ